MGSTGDPPICPASREIEGVAQCHLTSLGIAYLDFVISPYHAATVSENGSSSPDCSLHITAAFFG
jgi:hypothetical protein